MWADWSMNLRRKRLLGQLSGGPLHDYYQQPFASTRADCRSLEFIALDLETTGLDPQKDEILSIGLVGIYHQQIDLGSARHYLLCPQQAIPEQSAVIHHITDDKAACGATLESIFPELLVQLAGKVLIAHHARFEMQFLSRVCQTLYGTGFLIPVIDTQHIAKRTLERHNQTFRPQELRLAECRQRHQLPHYRLHNALSDALAAAELFLVQLGQYDSNKPISLKNFL